MSIKQLLDSGHVELNDRRSSPRFRFTGPVEVIAVDVIGAIVPTQIDGTVSEISCGGAVITLPKKLTCKGLFVRFAEDDSLVMPASVARTICVEHDRFIYALQFASEFDSEQLLRVLNSECRSPASSC